jgi:hypothetical protein
MAAVMSTSPEDLRKFHFNADAAGYVRDGHSVGTEWQ